MGKLTGKQEIERDEWLAGRIERGETSREAVSRIMSDPVMRSQINALFAMSGKRPMTDMTVAKTIAQQLGGTGRLSVMIGASNFGATDDSLTFSFKGSRKYNKCRITVNGLDLYKFELMQFRPKSCTCPVLYTEDGLYNDMLIKEFETATGLYLSLGTMGG